MVPGQWLLSISPPHLPRRRNESQQWQQIFRTWSLGALPLEGFKDKKAGVNISSTVVVISFLRFSWVHWLVNKHRLTEDSEDEVLFPSISFKCSFLLVHGIFLVYLISPLSKSCVLDPTFILWWPQRQQPRRCRNPRGTSASNPLADGNQHDPCSLVVRKTASFPFLVAQMT